MSDRAELSGKSYARILQSTAVIGVSFVIVVVLSFIRMKVTALLLGPTGIGMVGLLGAVLDLAVVLAGLGIQQSGVRQIAQADGEGGFAPVAMALLWTSLGLGLFGAVVLALLSVPVAVLTFGTGDAAIAIAIVGGAVFLRLLSGGQLAIIQGLRRITSLAQINVISALLSTLVCVPVIYIWRERAIAPSIVIIAGMTAFVAWLYTRRLAPFTRPSLPIIRAETGGLIGLGVIFMASGLMTVGAAYIVRIVILHSAGIDAAGLYQAAWTVAALYSGFVLQAMGSDFYPRLTGIAKDNTACNKLVNEQVRVSLLLATPGVMATISLAGLVLGIFYSSEFLGAAGALRWICLGTMLQTMFWPVGFILLAKGARKAFFWMEVAAATVQIGLTVMLVPIFGFEGAGMAFCGLYACYGIAIYRVAGRVSGFRWTTENRTLAIGCLSATAVVFLAFQTLPMFYATALGLCATVLCSLFALRSLLRLVAAEIAVPPILRPLLARLTPAH